MSASEQIPTETEVDMRCDEMPVSSPSVQAIDVRETPNGEQNVVAPPNVARRDTPETNALSGDVSEGAVENNSLLMQSASASTASGVEVEAIESKDKSTDVCDVVDSAKVPVVWPFTPAITRVGDEAEAETCNTVDKVVAEAELLSLETTPAEVDDKGDGSDARGVVDDFRDAADKTGLEEPSLLMSASGMNKPEAEGLVALPSDAPEKLVAEEGPPPLQPEPPPLLIEEVQSLQAGQNVTSQRKRQNGTGGTRSTHEPPVLEPEVITLDDDEPVCVFEEPPLLLPEVAVTRKRKGIVRKRSFYGDTVDSSFLKETILESSPAKKAQRSGVTSLTQSKPSTQAAFTSRIKDDGVTVLISRCGKSENEGAGSKPKTPSKLSGSRTTGDGKKLQGQAARPRLLNRQPLENKPCHVTVSVAADGGHAAGHRTTVTGSREKPLARRMGSSRQPSRRSGTVRCGTSPIVRSDSRFAVTAADQHVTSTGWRSVMPVQLGDVSTHCGYAEISGHAREAFAPVPPPPGELVAVLPDPELTERIQKIAGEDEPDPDGVFVNPALEGFLEEKAPLKLSFPVPDCLMRREEPCDEEPEYPPSVQPPPTLERPPDQPRFKTLLEKHVWLGIRNEEDLRAARSVPLPAAKDSLSSESLPLHSLLLPPRYLTPARSSRDLAVHRAGHLLPLCKVMHKSLGMRRAWDDPAKGADCVQFVYDRHRQVRIRGSMTLNAGPTTRAFGKVVRPEAVQAKLNAWRRKDYRVSTEVVSRQRALLVSAAVRAPPAPVCDKPRAVQESPRTPRPSARAPRPSPRSVRQSPRTPRPRRRLLFEDSEPDRKTDPANGSRALPVVEQEGKTVVDKQENSIADQREESISDQHEDCITDQQEDSIVNQEEESMSDKQENSVAGQQEDSIADQENESIADEEDDSLADQQADSIADQQEDALADLQADSLADQQEDSIAGRQDGDFHDQEEDSIAQQQEGFVADQQEDDFNEQQCDSIIDQQEDGSSRQQDNSTTDEADFIVDEREEDLEDQQEKYFAKQQEHFVGDKQGDDVAEQQEDLIANQTDVVLRPLEEDVAHLEESTAYEDATNVDAIYQPTGLACAPSVKRTNSREAEVQACLGPDTLEDSSAVADVFESNCGDAMLDGGDEEAVLHFKSLAGTEVASDSEDMAIEDGVDRAIKSDGMIVVPSDSSTPEGGLPIIPVEAYPDENSSSEDTMDGGVAVLMDIVQESIAAPSGDHASYSATFFRQAAPVNVSTLSQETLSNDTAATISEDITAESTVTRDESMAVEDTAALSGIASKCRATDDNAISGENAPEEVTLSEKGMAPSREGIFPKVEPIMEDILLGNHATLSLADTLAESCGALSRAGSKDALPENAAAHFKGSHSEGTAFVSEKISKRDAETLSEKIGAKSAARLSENMRSAGVETLSESMGASDATLLADQASGNKTSQLEGACRDNIASMFNDPHLETDLSLSQSIKSQDTIPLPEGPLDKDVSTLPGDTVDRGFTARSEASGLKGTASSPTERPENGEDIPPNRGSLSSPCAPRERMPRGSGQVDLEETSTEMTQSGEPIEKTLLYDTEVASSSDKREDGQPKSAIAGMSDNRAVVDRPGAHLACLRALLEKDTHHRNGSGAGSVLSHASDGDSSKEGRKCFEATNNDGAALKKKEDAEELIPEAYVTTHLDCTRAVKTEKGADELKQDAEGTVPTPDQMQNLSRKSSIKNDCASGEEEKVCKESSCVDTEAQRKTEASKCALLNNDEKPDIKDKCLRHPPSVSNEAPNDTVAEAVKAEPTSVSQTCTSSALTRRACVHLPRYRLTAVRPYCVFHEVHDCPEFRPGGSCYMLPLRQRIVQLQRGLAIRTGRLPPLPARHQHAARTFGRVRPKLVGPRPLADSCVASPPVPDGTPVPPPRAPPMRLRLRLPESVDIAHVSEVVLLTPARASDGTRCHGVRLRSGTLVPIGSGTIRPGVPWRLQPADNVTVTSADGRRFRNATDRGCTAAVDVEGAPTELLDFPLADVNRSLDESRMVLTAAPDGGLTLASARMRVWCNERLRRVGAGQKGRRELFSTGSVVLMDNAGQLSVLGAVAPDERPEGRAEIGLETERAPQPVGANLGGGAKSSKTEVSAAGSEGNDVSKVASVAPGGVNNSKQASAHKRAMGCDANPDRKKRQRVSRDTSAGEGRVSLARTLLRGGGGEKQLKATASFVLQPRSSSGRFMPMAKAASNSSERVAKPASVPTILLTKHVRNMPGTEVAEPAEKRIEATKPIGNVPSAVAAKPAETLTASWVNERLKSVTEGAMKPLDKPTVAEVVRKPVENPSAAGTTKSAGNLPVHGTEKRAKVLSATGVLMSVVQKIANGKTNPARSPISADAACPPKTSTVGNGVVPPTLPKNQHICIGRQLPKAVLFVPTPDTNGEAPRKPKLAFKPAVTAPPKLPSSESGPKPGSDLGGPQSLLKRAFVAECSPATRMPDLPPRSPKSRVVQRAPTNVRRKRPGETPVEESTTYASTPPTCDPDRPKMRRKSWADLPNARRSWADNPSADEGSEDVVTPRRRSWDNPTARQSWTNPEKNRRSQADRPRARKKSGDPQNATRRKSGGHTTPRRKTGDPQPIRQNSENQPKPRAISDPDSTPHLPVNEPAARLSAGDSRRPPALLRRDGVAVRRRSGGGSEPVAAPAATPAAAPGDQPTLVDLTTPEKAPPPSSQADAKEVAEAERAAVRKTVELPLEVTLLNESDMSDDGLEDLDATVPAPARVPDSISDDVYCPNIQLIEL